MKADKRKSLKKHLASGVLVSTLFSLLVLGPKLVSDVSWFWQHTTWCDALPFTVLATFTLAISSAVGGVVGLLVFEVRNK